MATRGNPWQPMETIRCSLRFGSNRKKYYYNITMFFLAGKPTPLRALALQGLHTAARLQANRGLCRSPGLPPNRSEGGARPLTFSIDHLDRVKKMIHRSLAFVPINHHQACGLPGRLDPSGGKLLGARHLFFRGLVPNKNEHTIPMNKRSWLQERYNSS